MKNYLLLLFTIIVISGCETDDFCTLNPVTPQLIIDFHDFDNQEELKTVERLSVIAVSKTDSLISSETLSRILIPLNSQANETVYTLKMNNSDGNIATNQLATFTIKYTPEEEFVSRSCGFRIIYNDVSFTSDNTWIKEFTPSTLTTINNQTEAHVKIFH